jgi:NACHT domain
MKLYPQHIAKVDPLLQEALSQASGEEVIRAVMALDMKESIAEKTLLDPARFSSRQSYRQALIEQREEYMSEALRETLHALDQLSLTTMRTKISPIVVVEGAANEVLRSLEVPGVRHASLDRFIGLPELVTNEQIDHISNLYSQALDRDIDSRTGEIIRQAAEQYILKFHSDYGKVKILAMVKPVELEAVFTAPYFLEQPNFLYLEPEEVLKHRSDQRKRGFQNQHNEKMPGIDIANQFSLLMILGVPGSGKSTFLRKIGLEALKGEKGEFKHACLPVLIELKNLSDVSFEIENRLTDILRECQFPLAEQFTERALEQGKFLILLDGLDDIPIQKAIILIPLIQKLLNSYHKNRFILSRRTNIWHVPFIKFKYVEIAEFNDHQIQQFLKRWFFSKLDRQAKKAEECWALLSSENHEATIEIARNPLFLTFICLVYDKYQNLPKNRAFLYGEVLDILLSKWLESWRSLNNTEVKSIYSHLDIELEKNMLSSIAYHSFAKGELFLKRYTLVNQIHEFLIKAGKNLTKIDAELVLDAIVLQQGIFVMRARDSIVKDDDLYSFSHLTIQEYLAAQYIANHQKVENLVSEHLPDQRWKEVFLLIAGLLPNKGEELLSLINREVQGYLRTDVGKKHLVPLLNWTNKVTKHSKSDLSSLGKRCLAVAFASANAYAYSYADAYARATREAFELAYSDDIAYKSAQNLSYAFSLAHCHSLTCSYVSKDLLNIYSNAYRLIYAYALAKAYYHTSNDGTPNLQNYKSAIVELIRYARRLDGKNVFNKNEINITKLIGILDNLNAPKKDSNLSEHREFSRIIINTWTNAFLLDSFLERLDRKALEEIGQHYFYPNWLMVQCKQAAMHNSNETWEAIESTMLIVPEGT